MQNKSLLQRQWETYPRNHRTRANLLLHIVAVPMFLAANTGLLVAIGFGRWGLAGFMLAGMIVSMAIQGRGHKIEPVPPEPFSSPFNAIGRIFLEQWITFPKFVLSGAWWRALQGS